MKTKEEIESDKALAYFMGWRIDNSFPDKDRVWRKGNAVELETTFKFSSDWNWLMEVNDAINSLEFYRTEIVNEHCTIFYLEDVKFETPYIDSKIDTKEAVYNCFALFADYYNKLQFTK